MFHVDAKKLLREEKENGVANVCYYQGVCLTCAHSPNREVRAACPKADFFSVITYISQMADAKGTKHLCKNWELCTEIISGFKKNQPTEPEQNHPKNGWKSKNNK